MRNPLANADVAKVAIAPQYLLPAWEAQQYLTFYVEKVIGSGVFQDLYPHTDGRLYTAPGGGGTGVSVWAETTSLCTPRFSSWR